MTKFVEQRDTQENNIRNNYATHILRKIKMEQLNLWKKWILKRAKRKTCDG